MAVQLPVKLSARSRDRLSTAPGDPGYQAFSELIGAGKNIRIFLDGQEVNMVVTADPGLGVLTRLACDGDGSPRLQGDELLYEDLRGVVTWKAEAPETSH